MTKSAQTPKPQVEKDLWGRPGVYLRSRRGRPSFAKTEENQTFVENRAALGWTPKRIGEAMGCSEDTVRRNFAAELENAAMTIDGETMDALRLQARRGHVPSIRLLRDILREIAPPAPRAKPEAAEPKPEALGKKEQRLLDAADTPDDWGDIYSRMDAEDPGRVQ